MVRLRMNVKESVIRFIIRTIRSVDKLKVTFRKSVLTRFASVVILKPSSLNVAIIFFLLV